MKDVHTEHCCIIHGCKYMEDDCTVITEKAPQSYPCEECSCDKIDRIKEPKVSSVELFTIYDRGTGQYLSINHKFEAELDVIIAVDFLSDDLQNHQIVYDTFQGANDSLPPVKLMLSRKAAEIELENPEFAEFKDELQIVKVTKRKATYWSISND